MTDDQTTKRGPIDDMWRVDVLGFSLKVRGEPAKDHLERVNRQLAQMKLALHKIARSYDEAGCGDIAREALKNV